MRLSEPGAARRLAVLGWVVLVLLTLPAAGAAVAPPPLEGEAPRVRALLEQAWTAESGAPYQRDLHLALVLYCHAGLSGSSEGYFRIGRLLVNGPDGLRDEVRGRGYLVLAAQLGHQQAAGALGDLPARPAGPTNDCARFEADLRGSHFDMGRYIAGLPAPKRMIAELIRRAAPAHDVPVALALAIACAESDFDARAVSPKQAQGVMQLIPETQKRFGVTRPFDARQNIRGGLRYLKWLQEEFGGNVAHVVAAYNAGEGRVRRDGGLPPFAETRAYVRRVLFFAGFTDGL